MKMDNTMICTTALMWQHEGKQSWTTKNNLEKDAYGRDRKREIRDGEGWLSTRATWREEDR